VFVKINGVTHYLWRAVDQDGTVLDVLMQARRDKHAAVKFLRKLLSGLRYVPRGYCQDKSRGIAGGCLEAHCCWEPGGLRPAPGRR